MTMREGKIRETYGLSIQKTLVSVKLCLKRHKSVSKLWRKKSQEAKEKLQQEKQDVSGSGASHK